MSLSAADQRPMHCSNIVFSLAASNPPSSRCRSTRAGCMGRRRKSCTAPLARCAALQESHRTALQCRQYWTQHYCRPRPTATLAPAQSSKTILHRHASCIRIATILTSIHGLAPKAAAAIELPAQCMLGQVRLDAPATHPEQRCRSCRRPTELCTYGQHVGSMLVAVHRMFQHAF